MAAAGNDDSCAFKIIANAPSKGAAFRINELASIWEHSDTCTATTRTRSISVCDVVTDSAMVRAVGRR